ncbi:MAG: hypothetical protein IAE91_03355 [Ignavibacteriaceae bacterium]|nr:hypothetical protein [Ignavibacteriaceae bacterium]
MGKLILFFTLFILTATSFGQNVKVSDYQVPVSTAKIFRLSGFYNFNQTTNDSATTVLNNSASATAFFRYFYSSLPFAWFIDVDATGGKNFDEFNHDISIRPSIRKYFSNESDFFGFGALSLRHANTYKQIASDLTVGGGYGRYINATALAKAVRIEEHLKRENVITGFLPKNTMIAIANIIEREDEYRGVFGDTYEKEWYEAIEGEIKASGMLTGNSLGAIGILRTQQVLKSINERVNERYYGWDLTLGVQFNLSRFDKSETRAPALSVGGRYSHPISWQSQVNAFFSVSTPMDSTFFKDVIGQAEIDYIYELSNRINFVAAYRINYIVPNIGDSYADQYVDASFIFYLENNINLGVNASLAKFGSNFNNRTDIRTSISLQYNLF